MDTSKQRKSAPPPRDVPKSSPERKIRMQPEVEPFRFRLAFWRRPK